MVTHQWLPSINWGTEVNAQLSLSHTVGESPDGTLGVYTFTCGTWYYLPQEDLLALTPST